MKKIITITIFAVVLKGYSQNTKAESVRSKNVYFQTDFGLSAYILISNSIFERQSIYYNATGGYLFKKSMNKKIKKSIQINVYYYTETLPNYPISGFDTKDVDFFITPEMKLLFNKSKYNKGFYSTIGIGGGVHNHYEATILKEKNPAWNLLGSIGYIIPIKRFYVDFKLGAGSYFAYKTIYYTKYTGNSTPQEFYDGIQKYNPNPSLKKVEINNSTIIYKYKYLGIMQGSFIPNFGINIGICF